jgi:hypothetical protein
LLKGMITADGHDQLCGQEAGVTETVGLARPGDRLGVQTDGGVGVEPSRLTPQGAP